MFIATRLRVTSLFLAAPLVLCAQDRNASQADLIQALLARIDKLEKRVTELESKTVPTAAVEQTPVMASPHEHEAPPVTSGTPNLRIAGFSDINFAATDQR